MASASPGEIRAVALLEDLSVDVVVERPGVGCAIGDVYRGRVTARVPAMAGAFVALGNGQDGFLPDSAGAAAASEGMSVQVRIIREAQGGKGPRLAGVTGPAVDPGPPGRLARGPGAIEQLSALHPEAQIAVNTPSLLAAARARFGGRVSLDCAAFDDAVETELEQLAVPVIPLPGGGRMMIEPTSALVAIDVDLGSAASGRERKQAAHLAANTAAIAEVARQIRLRSLGGPIVVDVAGLSPRGRQALAPAFTTALADDPAQARFLGFSALGLAEILRPRTRTPLHELLGSAHGAALAALRAVARQVDADPAWVPAVWAAPDVAQALSGDTAAQAELAARCGRSLSLHTAPGLPPRRWSFNPT